MNKKWLMAGLCVWLSLSFTVNAEEPENALDAAKADNLILQLGEEDWNKRNSAHEKLEEIGRKLFDEYEKIKYQPDYVDKQADLKLLYGEIGSFAEILKNTQFKDPEIQLRIDGLRKTFSLLASYSRIALECKKGSMGSGIYVMDVTGKNVKRLTSLCGDVKAVSGSVNLNWNSGGDKLLFAALTESGTFIGPLLGWDIYVYDMAHSSLKRLTDNLDVDDCWPDWSPDGTKIVFQSNRDGNPELYMMDTDGESQKKLTSFSLFTLEFGNEGSTGNKILINEAGAYFPVWSPDGKKITCYRRYDKDSSSIYVMDADGKNQKEITGNRGCNLYPVWQPDSTRIAFDKDREELYLIDTEGNELEKLAENIYGAPVFSPYGLEIAIASAEQLQQVDNEEIVTEIHLIDMDKRIPKKLVSNAELSIIGTSLAFNSDGTKIAFSALNKHGQCDIYVVDIDGKNLINITESFGEDRRFAGPAWCSHSLKELEKLFAEKQNELQNELEHLRLQVNGDADKNVELKTLTAIRLKIDLLIDGEVVFNDTVLVKEKEEKSVIMKNNDVLTVCAEVIQDEISGQEMVHIQAKLGGKDAELTGEYKMNLPAMMCFNDRSSVSESGEENPEGKTVKWMKLVIKPQIVKDE